MGGFKRFFAGSSYFFRGLRTLLGGGGLRRWAVLPIVINFFVFVGIGAFTIWTAWHYASRIAEGGWGTLWGTLAVSTIGSQPKCGRYLIIFITRMLAIPPVGG